MLFKDDLCGATYERQEATAMLAKEVDLVLVVGGKMSSNTTKLYKLAKTLREKSYFIENTEELKKEWFEGIKRVGITSGASTPDWVVEEIEEWIENEIA